MAAACCGNIPTVQLTPLSSSLFPPVKSPRSNGQPPGRTHMRWPLHTVGPTILRAHDAAHLFHPRAGCGSIGRGGRRLRALL